MRIRGSQDFATGVLFVAIGLAAYWIGADYAMGSAQRPGTGVLPRILSLCLMGTGGLLVIKSIYVSGAALTGWAWRPVLAVTIATIVFGFMIDGFGLVVSMIVSMAICALGTPETRWTEFVAFTLIMIAVSWGMFIWLLGMPIRTWPDKLPPFIEQFMR
jgi:hypothetical protein